MADCLFKKKTEMGGAGYSCLCTVHAILFGICEFFLLAVLILILILIFIPFPFPFPFSQGWKHETTMSALRDILGEEMSYFGYGQEKVFSYTVPTLPQNWTFSQEDTKKKQEGKKAEGLRKKVEKFQEKRKDRKEEELEELVEEIGVIEGGSNAWVVSGKYTDTGSVFLLFFVYSFDHLINAFKFIISFH